MAVGLGSSQQFRLTGELITTEEKFGRKYFEGDGYTGLYRDFPVHYNTAKIVLDRKPISVLEVGGGRGYVCRILQSQDVKAVCMDVSKHCWHTRAINEFVLHDVTVVPWKFKDKEFDLCFSQAFLEHVPENSLNFIIKEMSRVSERGLHGIPFTVPLNDNDKTHGLFHPKEWWVNKFKEAAPMYPVEIMDKEDMEKGIIKTPESDGLVKLNIGSFMDQFHYGWENWDILNLSEVAKKNGYVFRQVDVTKGVPKPERSVDIILASHMIEHLSREDGLKFLAECLHSLKPNGLIRLAVPDSKLLAEKFLKGEISEYKHVNIGVENASDDAESFYHLLLAGHQTIYDYESLKSILEKVGFQNIRKMEPFKSQSEAIQKQTIPLYPSLSVYIEATAVKTQQIRSTEVTNKKDADAVSSSYKKYLLGEIEEGSERI